MSSVPVPPPRKKKPSSASNDKFSNFYGNNGGFPSGRQTGDSERGNDEGILNESPDATIGDEVTISGDMQFDQLLRIDGRFEGKLLTEVTKCCHECYMFIWFFVTSTYVFIYIYINIPCVGR